MAIRLLRECWTERSCPTDRKRWDERKGRQTLSPSLTETVLPCQFALRERIVASIRSKDSDSLIFGFRQMLKGICDGEPRFLLRHSILFNIDRHFSYHNNLTVLSTLGSYYEEPRSCFLTVNSEFSATPRACSGCLPRRRISVDVRCRNSLTEPMMLRTSRSSLPPPLKSLGFGVPYFNTFLRLVTERKPLRKKSPYFFPPGYFKAQ